MCGVWSNTLFEGLNDEKQNLVALNGLYQNKQIMAHYPRINKAKIYS